MADNFNMGDTVVVATTSTAVLKTLYDANTVLAANTDDTPAALTVAASTVVGRKATGNIAAMTGAEAGAVVGPTLAWNKTVSLLAAPLAQGAGTWAAALDGNAFLNGNMANVATQAQNDNFTAQVDLAAGTWSLYVVAMKNTGGTIATFEYSQDSGGAWTTIGTSDTYAAAKAATVIAFTGIVVALTAKTWVRFTAGPTRNASANSWQLYVSEMIWQRTA